MGRGLFPSSPSHTQSRAALRAQKVIGPEEGPTAQMTGVGLPGIYPESLM
jgi:hypothetical protein